jgi:murein hydrolase activator
MKNNLSKKFFLALIWLIIMQISCFAQTKSEVEKLKKDKAKNENEIKNIQKFLKEAQKTKTISENKLQLINKNIELRKDQINIIGSEIELLNEKIAENTEVIVSLEKDLKNLKNEYAKMVVYAYNNRDPYLQLMYILASEDFNQAYKRIQFVKEYSEYRKNQLALIKSVQETISGKIVKLEEVKAQKQNLVVEKNNEAQKLSGEKQLQAKEIDLLKDKEQELKSKLAEKRKEIQRLDQEIRKAIERIQKQTAAKGIQLSPTEQIVSDQFGGNKGGLPWPTESGVISLGFGPYKHPTGVTLENSGIDITTQKGASVKCVFEGKVVQIINLPSGTKAVLLQHGLYFTLYSNLKEVYVVTGDQLKRKDVLGIVYTDPDDNTSIVHFEIWKEFTKMNPALWLSR